MAKDHIRKEGNPEDELARNEQMLSTDRYFNHLLGKDEIDHSSRPLGKPYPPRRHGAVDTMFVQFYSTLLPIAKSKDTLSAGSKLEIESVAPTAK